MSADVARRFGVKGTVSVIPERPSEDVDVALDLTQAASDRQARGTLTVTDRKTNTTFQARSFGLIQTTENWGTVTARVSDQETGTEHALLVIVEQRDPWIIGRIPSVTLILDGEREIAGPLTRGRADVSGRVGQARPMGPMRVESSGNPVFASTRPTSSTRLTRPEHGLHASAVRR